MNYQCKGKCNKYKILDNFYKKDSISHYIQCEECRINERNEINKYYQIKNLQNQKFYCEFCDTNCRTNTALNKHNKTIKHEKKLMLLEDISI